MDLDSDLDASTLQKFTPLQESNSSSFLSLPASPLLAVSVPSPQFLEAVYPLVAKRASPSPALAPYCHQAVEHDSVLCCKNNRFLIM